MSLAVDIAANQHNCVICAKCSSQGFAHGASTRFKRPFCSAHNSCSRIYHHSAHNSCTRACHHSAHNSCTRACHHSTHFRLRRCLCPVWGPRLERGHMLPRWGSMLSLHLVMYCDVVLYYAISLYVLLCLRVHFPFQTQQIFYFF